MEVRYWDGGLEEHEVRAIEKIKETFSKPNSAQVKQGKLGTSLKDLRALAPSPMDRWKGYAGFRFVDSSGHEGEFDLLIITHTNILIIELKHWNGGPITCTGDNWYKGDQLMGRSPVSTTRNKLYLIKNKIKPLRERFTNKGFTPFIEYFVVMTGNSDISKLPSNERKHTLLLDEFLELADETQYDRTFPAVHSKQKLLCEDIPLFDDLLIGNQTVPKPIIIDGWIAKSEIFRHPNDVYREFHAVSEASKKEEALIRRWDFNKLNSAASKTPDGRFGIVSREREVLQYIKSHEFDLYNHCLTSLTIPQRDRITAQYNEVYELPPAHKRFNEFIGKFGGNLSEVDRINLVKLLLAKFATLHRIKVAHRDIGDHSIWISPGKEIALSNFISAYHQPIGTIGSQRMDLSVTEGSTPQGMNVTGKTTPFQMDIYSLALLAWHILTAKRLSKASIKHLKQDVSESDAWYAPVIESAINGNEFRYAEDFFEFFMEREPKKKKNSQFELIKLERFRKDINHSRTFRDEGAFIAEGSAKEVYVSEGRLIKAWLNINPVNLNPGIAQRVHYFLERIEKLKSLAPPYLPKIIDYGIANKSSSIYLVSQYIDGNSWGSVVLDSRDRLRAINNLVSAVDHFHGLGFAHGDIHPENVIISAGENLGIYLIDTPDFCLDTEQPHNARYSPENIDGCSAFERDIFAVMRMSSEMLGLPWGQDSSEYPALALAIKKEIEDVEFGFKDLSRFKDAIEKPSLTSHLAIDTANVVMKGDFEPITLYPDNGQLYVSISKNEKSADQAIVQFSGIGGFSRFFYSKNESCITNGLTPRKSDFVRRKDREDAQLDLPFAIRISPGFHHDISDLNSRLEISEPFQRALTDFFKPEPDPLTKELVEAFKDIKKPLDIEPEKISITTRKLWKAIIETETESHPYLEVASSVFHPKDNPSQIVIPYEAEKDALDGFKKTDEIEAIQIIDDKDYKLGEVVLRYSTLNEVRLHKLNNRARSLSEGDIVFFRSKADKSSYEKRKNALERMLNNEAIIDNLTNYFEPDCSIVPTNYGIDVTDEDFSRYDRHDDHGNVVSLNDKQRDAFQRLINFGPLSMLQGPPGTGKTEFIAAFVHYLIEKQNVRNVLLVSQSHEAVNTAAERIRRHCMRLGTPLEVVRFSNREGAVSDSLKDVYSYSIVSEKRELFKTELKYRVKAMAQPLGLDGAYLRALFEMEFGILSLITSLINIRKQLDDDSLDKDEINNLKIHNRNLEETIDRHFHELGDNEIYLGQDLHAVQEKLLQKLQDEYAVRPNEESMAKALVKISRDMIDVLGTERVNYDEFLARSRQLVAGTCVGIGQRHIGIVGNQYEWVIIDEAARSIASELAIAMQSGKRVLLVGDHKQLPPLYSEPHKKALARKLGMAAKGNDIDELIASDFARAFESDYGRRTGAQLLTQYRMTPAIGNLVSSCFYAEELENGARVIPEIYDSLPSIIQPYVSWLDTSRAKKLADHEEDKGVSIYNRYEADKIIELLKAIECRNEFVDQISKEMKEGEAAIGIICMYGEQKRLIRQKFKENVWSDKFKNLIKIDTVDSYQGKENRIIIVSITRSTEDLSPGFLRSPNRINVALSRAMDRLIIVGNSSMWRGANSQLPLGRVLSFMEDRQDGKSYQITDASQKFRTGDKDEQK